MGRISDPRRRVALLSISSGRRSRRGREVLLGKQDLPKSATAPNGYPVRTYACFRMARVSRIGCREPGHAGNEPRSTV